MRLLLPFSTILNAIKFLQQPRYRVGHLCQGKVLADADSGTAVESEEANSGQRSILAPPSLFERGGRLRRPVTLTGYMSTVWGSNAPTCPG